MSQKHRRADSFFQRWQSHPMVATIPWLVRELDQLRAFLLSPEPLGSLELSTTTLLNEDGTPMATSIPVGKTLSGITISAKSTEGDAMDLPNDLGVTLSDPTLATASIADGKLSVVGVAAGEVTVYVSSGTIESNRLTYTIAAADTGGGGVVNPPSPTLGSLTLDDSEATVS